MAATETVYILEDVIPYFETIIKNQATEIEQLQEVCTELETQTAIQQEQIEGMSLIVNYQFATLGFFAILTAILLLWQVFSKWFFRGV